MHDRGEQISAGAAIIVILISIVTHGMELIRDRVRLQFCTFARLSADPLASQLRRLFVNNKRECFAFDWMAFRSFRSSARLSRAAGRKFHISLHRQPSQSPDFARFSNILPRHVNTPHTDVTLWISSLITFPSLFFSSLRTKNLVRTAQEC